MLTVIIIMIAGILLGYFIRKENRLTKSVDSIISWLIYLLLFVLGISVGINEVILNNINTILLKVVLLTVGAIAGSVLVSYFTYTLFFKKYETSTSDVDTQRNV